MPTLNSLAATGLTINEFYTYQFCSPSRAAFLTGRYPYKQTSTRTNYIPASAPDGIDLGYNMVPKRLASLNYVSYHVGKWHQGFYAPEYTPLYRGFNYTNGFLCGGEDHFEQWGILGVSCAGQNPDTPRDIWVQNATAPELAGEYTGTRFAQTAVDLIMNHTTTHGSAPLFMYYALHNTHGPFQATPEFLAEYPDVTFPTQKAYYAMVSTVDSSVRNVTDALKAAGLWNNTLLVWATDNGAPIAEGGSNYPLRGGKTSNWEGGVKTPAFVNGGLLPANRRGLTLGNGSYMHIVDLYATFLARAGLNPSDGNSSGPSPIDSIDMWDWWTGASSASPRGSMVLDHNMYNVSAGGGVTGALRRGKYKLLVGKPGGEWQASWYGEFSPNASTPKVNENFFACGNDGSPPGCLFDIEADPAEYNDLASALPDVFASMWTEFMSYNVTYHPPVANPPDEHDAFCRQVLANQGVAGPWRGPAT